MLKPREKNGKLRSILIIRPGGIGDAVLLLPAIKEIQRAHPDAAIDILAEKRNSDIFSLSPGIRKLFLYDTKDGLFKALRGKYDTVIDTEQWYRLSAVVAFMTRAPIRIGFDTNNRRKLFNRTAAYKQEDYEAESFLNLASLSADKEISLSLPFISLPEGIPENIQQKLSSIKGDKTVAIFPGGSLPEKRWPSEGFIAVAQQLEKRGYAIVVVGGKNENEAGKSIAVEVADSVNLCGKLTLAETAVVLKKATLLVTNDSGIMHLAAGLGTKTVSIFGPGSPGKWAPRGKDHIFISAGTKCSPCTIFGHIPPCKKELRCIKDIRAEEVIEKALTLLKQDRHESN